MRKIIFLKNHTKKIGGEASPRHFSKNLKLNISLDQQSKIFYTICFYCLTKFVPFLNKQKDRWY